MLLIGRLLDLARQRTGLASDNQLATRLQVHRQAVSKWRHEEAYPSEDTLVQLARLAGEDPGLCLVAVRAMRSGGQVGRAWASVAQRLARRR